MWARGGTSSLGTGGDWKGGAWAGHPGLTDIHTFGHSEQQTGCPPPPLSERSESGCGGGGRMKLWSSGVKKRANTQRFALRYRGKYPWAYSWVNLYYAWLTADTHPWPPPPSQTQARAAGSLRTFNNVLVMVSRKKHPRPFRASSVSYHSHITHSSEKAPRTAERES